MNTVLHRHLVAFCLIAAATIAAPADDWTQWRGPNRDGLVTAAAWPAVLDETALKKSWRGEFGPSYSGPVVAGDKVFITESKNDTEEHVYALDRQTGKQLWHAQWEGYVKVPFFAKKNGDWIRATPAFDDGRLYVAGMRDHLVCLDAATGEVIWEKDFVKELKTPVPDFGFVSSPLVVGDAVYVQAAASFVKLDKLTGEVKWRSLQDKGGMWGSAFSSPVFVRLAGQDQLVMQSREKLAGIQPETGAVLWEQPIKAFRGMNILTPLVHGDRVFTTAYGGQAQQFEISRQGDAFACKESWSVKAEAYMSSPLLIDGHIYLHLRNQRFVCLDWQTGQQRWESEKKFGQYWSLVGNGRQILALDEDRKLHLIKANPEKFELVASAKVADEESWAYLAVGGDEIFVRDLKGVTAFKWQVPAAKVTAN